MSIQIPSDVIISNVKVSHNIPNFHTESLNLKSKGKSRSIHRLEGSFDITAYTEVGKRHLEMFLLKIQGRLNTFEIKLGGRFDSVTMGSNATTVSSESIGSNALAIESFSGNVTGGDYFNIANDTKVYMALNDTSSVPDAIEIYPPLRKNIPPSTVLNFTDVIVTAKLKEDIQSIDYSEGGRIHVYTIEWIEDL